MVSKNMGTRYRVSNIKVELFETEVNCWDVGRIDDLAHFVGREPDGREKGILFLCILGTGLRRSKHMGYIHYGASLGSLLR